MFKIKLFYTAFIFVFLWCLPVRAYVDPGFLSIIFSAIISFIAVTMFYIKTIFFFIKKKIRLIFSLNGKNNTREDDK
jgi:hypothetical protein